MTAEAAEFEDTNVVVERTSLHLLVEVDTSDLRGGEVEGSTSAAVAVAVAGAGAGVDAASAVDGVEAAEDRSALVQDLDRAAYVTWRMLFNLPRKHASIVRFSIKMSRSCKFRALVDWYWAKAEKGPIYTRLGWW